eukprot:Seg1091.1 transcript_id=Seg1091.1/GoldUCD/mRNA.D3Y31 product="hypothetical protein" protein_id=Seg1091.1/GoldUCD/D3Y31
MYIHSPDTDVLVILVSFADRLLKRTMFSMSPERNISVREIFDALGEKRSKALIAFHALTGCDTTGKFNGKGKGNWFKVFMKLQDDTVSAICSLQNGPLESALEIEKFVVAGYCPKTNTISTLAEARWYLFCKNPEDCEKFPPTSDAFQQHLLRAQLQAVVWYSSDRAMQPVLDPCDFGWKSTNGRFEPIGFVNNVAPTSLVQLTSCKCKKNCATNRCSCKQQNMSCADMCMCEQCENTESLQNDHFDSSDDDE